jgi:hypothetical protein
VWPPFVELAAAGVGVRGVRLTLGRFDAGNIGVAELTSSPEDVPVSPTAWGAVKALFQQAAWRLPVSEKLHKQRKSRRRATILF